MAGKGPPPKDPEKRARRNATLPTTTLPERFDGEIPVKLPKSYDWEVSVEEVTPLGKTYWVKRTKRFGFLAATKTWWDAVSHSPQATTFTIWAWQELLFLARLVDRFHRGDSTQASEMRLRAAKLGATPEDMLRLRLDLPTPPDPEAGKETPRKRSRARTDPRAHLKAVGD